MHSEMPVLHPFVHWESRVQGFPIDCGDWQLVPSHQPLVQFMSPAVLFDMQLMRQLVMLDAHLRLPPQVTVVEPPLQLPPLQLV